MSLESLITGWGPPAVFLGAFLEGETAATLGGMMAHRAGPGGLSGPFGMGGMAAAGAFLADQMWFLTARHLPDRGAMARLRAKARASRLAAGLERRRHVAAFLFRFLPGARIVGPVLLAQTGIGWPAFAAANALAVAIWATVFTALGYHFGLAAEAALGRLAAHHWLILAGLAGVAGLALHRHLRRRGQRP